MKDIDTQLAELNEKHTKAIALLEAERAALEAIGAAGLPVPRMTHINSLYGAVGSLSYECENVAEVLAILAGFTPTLSQSVYIYKGGCTSVRPTLAQDKEGADIESTGTYGAIVAKLDKYGDKVSFWATVPNAGLFRIDCEFVSPSQYTRAKRNIFGHYWREHLDGREMRGDRAHTFRWAHSAKLQAPKTIQWGGGDRVGEYSARSMSFFWPDVASAIAAIKGCEAAS